jgi:hypothetical protein
MYRNVPRRFCILSLLLSAPVVLPLVAILTGCGDKPKPPSEDARVIGLVTGVGEAAGSPDAFKSMFAEGAAPSEQERQKYRKYSYEVKSHRVSGDTATVTMNVKDVAPGSPVGEKDWTCVQTSNGWKIKEAPLP